MNEIVSRKPAAPKLFSALYKTVWRWHFYAGIVFAPFLLILAFSGSMYLFKPQIEGYLYKDLLTVDEIGTTAVSADDIVAKTVRAYPGTTISSITLSDDPGATVKMETDRNGTPTTMYADPYTGDIVGMLDSDKTFSAFF